MGGGTASPQPQQQRRAGQLSGAELQREDARLRAALAAAEAGLAAVRPRVAAALDLQRLRFGVRPAWKLRDATAARAPALQGPASPGVGHSSASSSTS